MKSISLFLEHIARKSWATSQRVWKEVRMRIRRRPKRYLSGGLFLLSALAILVQLGLIEALLPTVYIKLSLESGCDRAIVSTLRFNKDSSATVEFLVDLGRESKQSVEDCFERPPEVNIWSSLRGDSRKYVLEGENNEAYWENFRYSVRVLASKEEPMVTPGDNFYSSISFTINVQDWGSLLTDSKFRLAVDWEAPVEEHVDLGTGEITVDSKLVHANSCGYCVVHLGDTFLPAGQGHTERVLYNDLSFYAIDEQSAEYGGLAFVGWDQSFSYRAEINISDERRKSLSNTVGNVAFMLLGIAATLFFETLATRQKNESRVSG